MDWDEAVKAGWSAITSFNNDEDDESDVTFTVTVIPADVTQPIIERRIKQGDDYVYRILALIDAKFLLTLWPRQNRKLERGGCFAVDRDWRVRELPLNPRVSPLFRDQNKEVFGTAVLFDCNLAESSDTYTFQHNDATIDGTWRRLCAHVGLDIDGITEIPMVDARIALATRASLEAPGEFVARVYANSRDVQYASTPAVLPRLYLPGEWQCSKTPLAILAEYHQRFNGQSHQPLEFSLVAERGSVTGFRQSLHIASLNCTFTPATPSRQKQQAKHQVALMALRYLQDRTQDLDGEVVHTEPPLEKDAMEEEEEEEDEYGIHNEHMDIEQEKKLQSEHLLQHLSGGTWQNITPDGKVVKKLLCQGTGESLPAGTQVTVTYVGFYSTEADPTWSAFDTVHALPNNAFTYRVGYGLVIRGLDLSIASMYEGEEAYCLVGDCSYGYGALGLISPVMLGDQEGTGKRNGENMTSNMMVPPGAKLLFRIQLRSASRIVPSQVETEEEEELVKKLNMTTAEKLSGNMAFKKKNYKTALKCYNTGLSILGTIRPTLLAGLSTPPPELHELWMALLNNTANTLIKLGGTKYTKYALTRADQALARDPYSIKAMYHRANALIQLERFDDAQAAITHLLGATEPLQADDANAEATLARKQQHTDAQKLARELETQKRRYALRAQDMCRRMFSAEEQHTN